MQFQQKSASGNWSMVYMKVVWRLGLWPSDTTVLWPSDIPVLWHYSFSEHSINIFFENTVSVYSCYNVFADL